MAKSKSINPGGKYRMGWGGQGPGAVNPGGQFAFGWGGHGPTQAAGKGKGKPSNKKPAPKSKPAGTPAPEAPKLVDPFYSAADLQALNDFTTNYATSLSNLDFGLGNLQTDTDYQKTQADQAAQQQTAATQDNMAARGLFRSSVKDAALYDVEANRALQTKFLNDKLTAATLNAGTQKKLLGDSKTRFDQAMLAQQVENAKNVNDPLQAAWADKMATWQAAQPKPAPTPKPGALPKPGGHKPKPAAAQVPGSGQYGQGATAPGKPINTAQGVGRVPTGPRKPRAPRKPRTIVGGTTV